MKEKIIDFKEERKKSIEKRARDNMEEWEKFKQYVEKASKEAGITTAQGWAFMEAFSKFSV